MIPIQTETRIWIQIQIWIWIWIELELELAVEFAVEFALQFPLQFAPAEHRGRTQAGLCACSAAQSAPCARPSTASPRLLQLPKTDRATRKLNLRSSRLSANEIRAPSSISFVSAPIRFVLAGKLNSCYLISSPFHFASLTQSAAELHLTSKLRLMNERRS